MCGIFGFVGLNHSIDHSSVVSKFVKSLKHRGPDDNGYKCLDRACIGNTRLSIIDITMGHQPIGDSRLGVYVVQNGEIYNYIEVRNELKSLGYSFNTNSDTEVILNAYLEWGELFVNKLNGMFSIAILNSKENSLILYRDRLGVKPLYIFESKDGFFFSSELKSFTTLDFFTHEIDYQSIANYLYFNYVPIPNTIFKNVRHLKPGHYLKVDLSNFYNLKEEQYWNYASFFKEDSKINDDDILNFLDNCLYNAVDIRLRSDVEVGAFLSGGLDSSLVCAYMRNIIGQEDRISVYSIGFNEKKFDESIYSEYVASKYDLSRSLYKLDSDILKYWRLTTFYNDQPHGDTSFIPTYLLSQFAANQNKVVLTGDGGDELFAGYDKYKILNESNIDTYFNKSSLMNEDVINLLITDNFKAKVDLTDSRRLINNTVSQVHGTDSINKALYFDVVQLLPGNNLVKPDKMAMANSLETRSPFLDYRFYEFFASIPGQQKVKFNETKYYAKKLGIRHFKESHVYRDKQMFTVPVGEWFKNSLGTYIDELLFNGKFESRNLFKINIVRKFVDDHMLGKHNYTREIRALLNLEIWFRIFIDKESI